ncbi:hypothetical protein M0R45_005797 [Rubus argutus]|uniref:MHC class I antigen n=1 Tax=Rubus argutus TaxID=59490 RepID=A0AAW1YP85_RUBAR
MRGQRAVALTEEDHGGCIGARSAAHGGARLEIWGHRPVGGDDGDRRARARRCRGVVTGLAEKRRSRGLSIDDEWVQRWRAIEMSGWHG